jgi:hypothetical protein
MGIVILDDEAGHLGFPRFHILGIHAIIADLRVGHADDLPFVRRVREDLLITAHRGIEDDLTGRRETTLLSFVAKGATVKKCSVFEC